MTATFTQTPSELSVLETLTVRRIRELAREANLQIRGATKAELTASFVDTKRLSFRKLLVKLGRDELRNACTKHGLDAGGRGRQALTQRLLEAHGEYSSVPAPAIFTGAAVDRAVPTVGDTVLARHRKWLVDEIIPPPSEGDATWLTLTCLDDDNRGATLGVLWELELGARVIGEESLELEKATKLDPPRHFAAYLNTMRWQSVSAADKNQFQSPFRAGIEILAHQLTPLSKALALPRANLFIADDVGLGKTIEAGLVLQELELRQRVDFSLIICPTSVTLQWQKEMDQRFGLRFEVYTRDFVLLRKQERGFGVNPWTTHPRFILSYSLLRRPEYLEPLLAYLRTLNRGSARARKSLLILDEAHTAAPASQSRYAVDSRTTHTVREIASRFENRLFLSATPHNGHSNSFSALLEILDPQRFARGVPISGPDELDPIMVRRLKKDLRQLTSALRFPTRKVIRIGLKAASSKNTKRWQVDFGGTQKWECSDSSDSSIGTEIDLANELAEYSSLFDTLPKKARLPLINLQKRLLSSVNAFYRTLEVHASSTVVRLLDDSVEASDPEDSAIAESDAESPLGLDDHTADVQEDIAISTGSRAMLKTAPARALALLDSMKKRASVLRRAPDAKMQALLEWIRRHQCEAAGVEQTKKLSADARLWSGQRVLIFTEYTDTRTYIRDQLRSAIEHTDRGDDRILQLYGGMPEDKRAYVQHAFNSHPDEHPMRILIATDAAREGLNLQAHCADLFHYDIPWNPSRMEQRNGRIDRTLQPSPEVRCHYFVYEDRTEDAVLDRVVRKAEIIHAELGSLGEVVSEKITDALKDGIVAGTLQRVERAIPAEGESESQRNVERELESTRKREVLRSEIDAASAVYESSKKRFGFHSRELRDAINVGLELLGTEALQPVSGQKKATAGKARYILPSLPPDWSATLDPMRPPLDPAIDSERASASNTASEKQTGSKQNHFKYGQKPPPRPVVFEAEEVLAEESVHLHLEHPFVKRLLSRFLAQGFGAHDLSRVSAIAVPDAGFTHAIAIGRLCLFGQGAARLHDSILYATARVYHKLEGKGAQQALALQVDALDKVESERAWQTLQTELERASHDPTQHGLERFSGTLQTELLGCAQPIMQKLLEDLRNKANAEAHEVSAKLAHRAEEESAALSDILRKQRDAIHQTLERSGKSARERLGFRESTELAAVDEEQVKQLERDREYLKNRLEKLKKELEREPLELKTLYEVKLKRFEPLGLIFLYPKVKL
jgi:superfamily II DNA/RNA helicase